MIRSLCAAVWFGLLLGGLPVLAQEAAEPPKSPEPSWAYITLTTGPLERVEASFAELGIPVPTFLRRATIERQFPLIGPGGLRGSGSLGMRMGASEPDTHQPGTLMLLPVNPDVAPLQTFTSKGAKLLPGSTDAVRLKNVFFRRTPGFLVVSPQSQAGILEFDPEASEERLTAPGLLAEVDVNLELWRKTDPASFYRLVNGKEESEQEDPSHVTSLGRSLGERIYERLLNRIRLTLNDTGPTLRLGVELDPLAPGELAPLPRPAFPGGVLGRLDIVYASIESSQWIEGMTEQFMNAAQKDHLFAPLERTRVDVEQVRALFKEAITLFWTADAISLAVEPVKGRFIYHQVNQYRSPAGFTDRVAALVKKMNALDPETGRHASGIGFTSTNASGVRTSRLTFPGSKFTIDSAESGTTVRMIMASDTPRRLAALLKLPEEGALSSGFSGMFDPNAAVDAYLATGGILPFPLRMRAREDLRGQLITWTTHAQGTAATVDIDVPKPLARIFLQRGSGSSAVDDSKP